MKKLMLLAASGLMIAGLSSCKKEYTCTCTTTVSYSISDPAFQSFLPTDETTTTTSTSKQKKKDSEDWCKANENEATSSQSIGTISYSANTSTKCSL